MGNKRMKRSILIFVAFSAFTVFRAQAQSDVTIGGVVEANGKWYKVGNSAASSARATAASNEFRIDDDYKSRFWLTGKEDLGGGLFAIFYIENQFSSDVEQSSGNATGAGLGDGETWIGLRGNWGQITVGKHTWMLAQGLYTEFMGANGATSSMPTSMAGTFSILDETGQGVLGYLDVTRRVNSVTYRTPVMSGFSGALGFSPNSGGNEGNLTCTGATGLINGPYTTGVIPATTAANGTCGALSSNPATVTTAGAINGSYSDGREWYLQGAYANGPLWLNLAYRNYQVEGRNGTDMSQWRFSGLYRFAKAFKVGLQIDRAINTTVNTVGAATTSVSRTAWEIPFSYAFGNNVVMVNYTKAGDLSGAAGTGGKMWTLGWDYSLSKHTNVGVWYSKLSNGTNSAYQPFLAGSSMTGSALAAGESASSFALCIKHAF
jgi:predicted porin